MSTAYAAAMIQDAPDGPGVLTPDDDGKFMMWDGSRKQMVMAAIRMTGQANTILRSGGYRIQDSSDGPGVLAVADDGKALVWDNGTGRFVMTAITSTLAGATDFGGTPGAGTDGYAIIWDDNAGEFTLGTFEASGAVAAHAALTTTHGVTGDIVGTGAAQTISGVKTFGNGLITGKVYPSSDATNAFGLYKADGTTQYVYGNSTSGRLGVGIAPTVIFEVSGTTASVMTRTLTSGAGAPDSAIQIGLGGAYTGVNAGGPSFLMFGNNSTPAKAFMGRITAVWENVTAGSEAASVTVNVRANTGDTTASTIAATFASTRRLGMGAITAPTASVHTEASTTARASLCLPHGSAPTSPVDGDMWTTAAGLYVRINGATVGPLS